MTPALHAFRRSSSTWPSAGPGASRVIDSLCTPDFERELMHCLHEACEAEHCVVYGLRPEGVQLMAAVSLDGSDYASRRAGIYVSERLWCSDSGFASAYKEGLSQRAHLVRVEKEPLSKGESQIPQKVFLFGVRNQLYGISVLRHEGRAHFPDAAVRRLEALGEFLVSCCGKHLDEPAHSPGASSGARLESVPAIESRLGGWLEPLTPRELQVCSRILFGMTVEGISLDLGIKPESIVTYRKRAFQKCGIGTRHELMRRYLGRLPEN